MTRAVVYTNSSGMEPYIATGVDCVIASENLGGVLVSTPIWNAKDVGLIPTLGAWHFSCVSTGQYWNHDLQKQTKPATLATRSKSHLKVMEFNYSRDTKYIHKATRKTLHL